MLEASCERIERLLAEDDLVLDVGGWAKPFPRSDWVIDLMPYETRGCYADHEREAERFHGETWVQADICEPPWPFAEDQFDFVICSHTLEDVRDPIAVCAELNRVAKAGYIEVPSRLEEQSMGVQGRWVGWSHHRWLIDVTADAVEFVAKPHVIHAVEAFHFPSGFHRALGAERRVQRLFWEGSFAYRERFFTDREEHDRYLASLVEAELGERRARPAGNLRRSWWRRGRIRATASRRGG